MHGYRSRQVGKFGDENMKYCSSDSFHSLSEIISETDNLLEIKNIEEKLEVWGQKKWWNNGLRESEN